MRWQTTAVVAVVLLALGAFYYVYEIKGGPARAKVEAQKGRLWTVDASDVTEVELKRTGKVVKLKREADGWQILEPVTARGDRARGRRLADTRARDGARRPGQGRRD